MAVVNRVTDDIPITLVDTNGVGRAGLAVTSTARRKDSTVAASAVMDRGNGDYDLTYTFPSAGRWRVTSVATIDGDPAIDITDIDVVTAAQDDPVAFLAAGEIVVISPVNAVTGAVTLFQGDDYLDVDTRSLNWATTSAGQWPDLTGASIAFRATHPTDKSRTFTAAGSVTTPTGSTKAVRVELTKTQTAAFLTPSEGYPFQVVATLANGDVATLVDATMVVTPRRG